MMDDFLYQFYKKIGETAGGIKTEQVIVDSLFKFAGELSVNVLKEKNDLKSNNATFKSL